MIYSTLAHTFSQFIESLNEVSQADGPLCTRFALQLLSFSKERMMWDDVMMCHLQGHNLTEEDLNALITIFLVKTPVLSD